MWYLRILAAALALLAGPALAQITNRPGLSVPFSQTTTFTGTFAGNAALNSLTMTDNTDTAGIASLLTLTNWVGGDAKANGVSYGLVSSSIQNGAYGGGCSAGAGCGGAVVGAAFLGSIGAGLNGGGVSTTVAITAVGGATSFTATSATGLVAGEGVHIWLDNGTPFVPQVTTIVGNVVNLDRVFPTAGASAGNLVMHALGRYKGMITNGASNTGSTSLQAVLGGEASISVRTGGSVAIKCIFCVTQNFDDDVAGSFYDMGMGVSSQAGNLAPLDSAFQVSDFAGKMPIGTTSSVLKSVGAGNVLHGINLISLTLSGNFAQWGTNGSKLTGDGRQLWLTGAAPSSAWKDTGVGVTVGGLWRNIISGGATIFQANTAAGGDFSSSISPLSANYLGDIFLGKTSAALATNAGAGYAFIPTMAGAPTGTPTGAAAGKSALVIDSTNHKICWYEQAGTVWKCALGS